MPLRFAINGFGRIGRALLRIAWSRQGLLPVAINDVVPARQLAPLLARDSVHGPFGQPVEVDASGALAIGDRHIAFFQEDDPARVPWGTAGAEVVVEATGRFLRRGQAAAHLRDGVRAVILSANADPAEPVDATFCLGLREPEPAIAPVAGVVSNASCTTNCLALLADVLHRGFGVRRAVMSTVHSYTENQRLLDLPHPDPRRARAAAVNIIPTSTTAARSVGLILPELAGRIDGFAVRVPTPVVALLDLVADVERDTTVEEVRAAYREAAAGRLSGVLGVTD
ncbi:MAG TPA: glyceraldehyde 3-phosphate dehydrogenase NAD-binding domain-containing protein, partial [Thermoanaerobaculia bacterium]